jgi:hypothetical protein
MTLPIPATDALAPDHEAGLRDDHQGIARRLSAARGDA